MNIPIAKQFIFLGIIIMIMPISLAIWGVSVISLVMLILSILVFLIGQPLLKRTKKRTSPARERRELQFFDWMIRLAVALMKVDGRLDRLEIQALKQFFISKLNVHDQTLEWVGNTIRQELHTPSSLVNLCISMNGAFPYEQKLIVINFLVLIAISDSEIRPAEQIFLDQVARLLGISERDMVSIVRRHHRGLDPMSRSKEIECYRVLGLNPGANQDAIKTAYRQMAKKYHPDVTCHLEERQRLASEKKMKAISESYEYLRTSR